VNEVGAVERVGDGDMYGHDMVGLGGGGVLAGWAGLVWCHI